MRLSEILNESVDFGAAKLIKDDPNYPDGLYSGMEWGRYVDEPCDICNGTGMEHSDAYDYEGKHYPAQDWVCRMCDGKKTNKTWVSDYPELNVANMNAVAILNALGLDSSELVGSVPNSQLPELRRKLIKLKNNNNSLLADPQEFGGEMRRYKDDNGMDKIGRSGKMYVGGRTNSQVDRYIDSLLKLCDWCQKNGADLVWG
jgi:hypothetical protein